MKVEFFNWFPKNSKEEGLEGWFWCCDIIPVIGIMHNYGNWDINLSWLFWQILIQIKRNENNI